jgi:type I restriction enzyme M protein
MPRADNGNYLWIQLFYSSLNATGRAGFVMANSPATRASPSWRSASSLIEPARWT